MGKLLRFLPALAWMAVIYQTSATPGLKSLPLVQRTGLLPLDLDPATANLLELLLRKSAHFLSYGLLALLLAWALNAYMDYRRACWTAFGLALLYAVSDEFHQSFVPRREGRWQDVAIDGAGAGLCLELWHLWWKRRERSQS